MNAGMSPATRAPVGNTVALVLPGGGARAAYQIGVLRAIADLLPIGPNPFPIIVGTSAGAVSATALATEAFRWPRGVAALESVWAGGLCWNHLEWHESERKKYLRLWVAGKTGGRWLIAKHRAVAVFERLAARQRDLEGKRFETLLESRQKQPVFRFSTGYQPHSFIGTFRRLMRDSGLLRATDGQNRTLYSLRHTYATQELLGGTDIHTLARQLGNSAQMIEKYYSKLTATLAAERLA